MRVAISIIALLILATGVMAEKVPYDYQEFTGAHDRQGGDTVDDATWVTQLPFSSAGTTVGYTHDYDGTCPFIGSISPDVVYWVYPCEDGVLDITLCGASDYDTKLYVWDEDLEEVACNDDYCPGYLSELMSANGTGVPVTGGELYYIIVDGYGGESGNYTLDITGMMCSPTPVQSMDFGTVKDLY